MYEGCVSLFFTPQCSYVLSTFEGFSSLRDLAISFVSLQELNVNFAPQFKATSLACLKKLDKLFLKGCEIEMLQYPPNLTILGLEDCPNLRNLPSNLIRLSIRTCPRIYSFDGLHTVQIASLNCPLVVAAEYENLIDVKFLRVRGQITDNELSKMTKLIRLDARCCKGIIRAPDFHIQEIVL